jgi:hypothetical protein
MDKQKLGLTGQFPNGKLNADDEGELTFAVGNDGRLVHVTFEALISSFAMTPPLARKFASALMRAAELSLEDVEDEAA